MKTLRYYTVNYKDFVIQINPYLRINYIVNYNMQYAIIYLYGRDGLMASSLYTNEFKTRREAFRAIRKALNNQYTEYIHLGTVIGSFVKRNGY